MGPPYLFLSSRYLHRTHTGVSREIADDFLQGIHELTVLVGSDLPWEQRSMPDLTATKTRSAFDYVRSS